MRYYRLLDDLDFPNRWFLKSLNIVDEKKISVWEFLSASMIDGIEGESIKISIRANGIPIDLTFADFEVIIVNEKVVSLLDQESFQLIPVEISGINTNHQYFIVNLLDCIDCLDENNSVFEKFEVDDPIRPDKAGQYSSISKLIVDPKKLNPQNNIFRLGKADDVIVISDTQKQRFEFNGVTGVKFLPVT